MPNSVIFEVPPSPRHTSHVFLLLMCVFSSIPTFLGKAAPPGSMEEALPTSLILLWAGLLTFGSAVALVGAFWRHKVTGLLIEQMGMLCVSVAAIYYFILLVKVVGWDSAQNSALVLGFGIACAVRYFQIQRFFNKLKHAHSEATVQQVMGDD